MGIYPVFESAGGAFVFNQIFVTNEVNGEAFKSYVLSVFKAGFKIKSVYLYCQINSIGFVTELHHIFRVRQILYSCPNVPNPKSLIT